MHLTEIFGLSTFLVFWTFRTFRTFRTFKRSKIFQKLNGLLTEKVCQNWKGKYQNFRQVSKMSKIYQNFQHMSKMSKFFETFDSKIAYFGRSKSQIFGTKTKTENVLEFLDFLDFFLQKAVHFCKNVPKFETLTRTHGLKIKHLKKLTF